MKLVLKNGIVFDPLNGINGEKMDIFIDNGRIVNKFRFKAKAKVIDLNGKVVMPGGFDIHTHIAGGKENIGRIMRPEDSLRNLVPRRGKLRAGSGRSVLSVHITGYEYAKMGYTTALAPATPPLMARHTHHELNEIPILDKAVFPLFDGNWFIMDRIADKDHDAIRNYVAWLLYATKGYAVKVVNPGGTEAWGWRKEIHSLDDEVPEFGVTPREILTALISAVEELKLPHSVHLHCNNLGEPGNFETTIETIKITEKFERGDRPLLHLTHLQFHCYAGDSWKNFESGVEEVAKAVKGHDITVDTGNLMFGDTTTMTADGPMEYHLQLLTGRKWANKDVELETAPGITPIFYSSKSPVNAVQWAIGLEIPLLLPAEKVMITTDHPNGAPFTKYPEIIAMLMSQKYREEMLSKVHKAASARTMLGSIDREYDLYEIAMVTRANQAKTAGFTDKGHLGEGAIADIAVYDLPPEPDTRDYESIIKAFSRAYLTIKRGEIVVQEGEVVNPVAGVTRYLDISYDRWIEKDVSVYFRDYYSVSVQNYVIGVDEMRRCESVPVHS